MNPANSQQALESLQGAQGSAKSAADILAGQQQKLGVQGAEDQVKGLRSAITNTTRLLNQVAPSVMGRTASSLVTSAQANRQVANEQQPISQQLSDQGRDYGLASEDYNRLSTRAREATDLEYGDQQNKLSYMQNLYNTLFSREQAAEQQRQAELARQEQIRQFNEQQAAERSRANSSSGSAGIGSYFNTPNSPPRSSGGGDPIVNAANANKQKAQSAVGSLLNTRDDSLIRKTIDAIKKSAGYGNTYDQMKLQLLQSTVPQYFNAPKQSQPFYAGQNSNSASNFFAGLR